MQNFNFRINSGPKSNNIGFSLLEILLVLSIISIILLAATRYYQSASIAQKANAGADMLQLVINGSNDWKNTAGGYDKQIAISGTPSDLSIPSLAALGSVPNSFAPLIGTKRTEANVNPWGGIVLVTQKDSNHITLKLTNVPTKDCKNLADIMLQKNVTDASVTCTDANMYYQADYPAT